MLITRADTYEAVYGAFRWQLPERYNIAHDVCDRHAEGSERLALIHERADGGTDRYSFRQIRGYANRLANTLLHLGLARGERVLIYLGQHPATAIAHVACWKAGLVSVPTSVLFGVDGVQYRLQTCTPKLLVTDRANYPTVATARADAPFLRHVMLVDGAEADAIPFWETIAQASDRFATLMLSPDDPAFLNFTSGTTGWPKGALQGHRSMIGHMPGFEFLYDFFPQDGDVMWSPADWAWLAGLMDVLMPAWFHGKPVLTYRAQSFDPEEAYRLMAKHRVRTALLTPTMLKLMRQVPDPLSRYDVKLRAVLSGGESVGKELLEWSSRTLGIQVNEGYGQTECNLVLGNCGLVLRPKPGSLGRALPGHVAAIVDDQGNELPAGTVGNIAFRRPDPVMLLEYWNNPKATAEKFAGDWLLTGDLGLCDEEGYFWFRGRADDVITSAGYRIGPSEIEDALTRHPAVAMAAVVGVPDPVRTESIKAFVLLASGYQPSDALAEEIRLTVRARLAKHEYPRAIEFVDSLPMTTTGKILRRELRERERQKRSS
jgi:acetyl-CoA synthetase